MTSTHLVKPAKRALFLVLLILTLPVHSAVVWAELRKASVSGLDNLEGYRKVVHDQTIITAEGRLTGDNDLAPEQFKIRAEGRLTPFTDCVRLADGYTRCTYKTHENTIDDEAKVYPFAVQLYTDTNALADERSLSLTYDNQPPKIFIDAIRQNKGDVGITVTIEDIACLAPGCEGKCAGIKAVDIDGQRVAENLTGCHASQTVFMPAAEEGVRTFIIRAIDYFNQGVTKDSAPFFVDGHEPVINEKISVLLDGQPVQFIGEDGVRSAWLNIMVKDHDLASVQADLSALNRLPEFQGSYKEKQASCARMASDRFECVWKDIYILPDKGTLSIQVNATDMVGRTSTKQVTLQLRLDTDKPVLKQWTTSGCKNDICYVSPKDNTIRADIEERGSGFTPFAFIGGEPRYRVGIGAHELSPAYGVLWADNCTGRGSSWTCLWHHVDALGPHLRTLTMTIPSLSTDDAGNTFSGNPVKRVVVDAEPPVLLTANVSSDKEGLLLEGSPLSIAAVIKDDTNIRGTAYVQSVLGIADPVSIECIPQDNMHLCSWNQLGRLLPGPIRSARITLLFHDLGGNSINKTLIVDVLAAEKEKKNYWSTAGKPTPMPKVLDRDTLFFEQRVYFTVPLAGPDNAKIIDGGITNCVDNNGFSTVRILSAADKTLTLQATVGPLAADTSLARLRATCTASLVSVINEERLTQPQEITIPLELPLVSSLGPLDDTLRQKIDDAKNWDLYGLRKIFKPLEQLYKIAEQICSGLNLFSSGALSGALGGFGLMGGGASGALLSQSAGLAAQSSGSMFNTMFKYCQYLSCDKTLFGSWYNNLIKEPEFSKQRHLGATAWPQNPKDNLFLSMATGCIPGVLYNLNKYKQLQCIYVDCLQNQVSQGVPMQYCVNQHEYLKCRFLYGQVFDLIPFAHVVKRMAIYMKTIFANPLSMVFGLGSFACEQRYAGLGSDGMMCAIARTMPQALSLVTQFQSFGQFQNDLLRQGRSQDVCAKVDME